MYHWFVLRHLQALVVIVVALTGPACSGDSPTAPSNATPRFTATIDGAVWQSDASQLSARSAQPGVYQLRGGRPDGPTVSITLTNITGTGRYPLGVFLGIPGGSVTVSENAAEWMAISAVTGTIDITTLTTTRIGGTFSVTARRFSDDSQRTITNGSFLLDLQITGNGGVAPAPSGSSFTATIDGVPWTAASISGSLTVAPAIGAIPAGTTFSLTAIGVGTVQIRLFTFTGVGSYPATLMIPPSASITMPSTSGESFVSTSGTVTITGATADRISGTFTSQLSALPSSSTRTITGNFTFSLKTEEILLLP